MPAFPRRPDQRPVQPARLGLGQRRLADPQLDLAPLGVQLVQPGGDRDGFLRIIRGQQPCPKVCPPDPPARIHARPQQKAKRIAVRGLIHPRHIGQRHKAGAFAPGHHLQPLAHQGAVHPDQRGHIGDRGQRHQIKHPHQVRPLHAPGAQPAVRLDQQQEHDRGGAKVAQQAILVLPVRVHHRQGGGQGFRTQMVVQHNHIRALGRGNRLMAQRAAIDAQD